MPVSGSLNGGYAAWEYMRKGCASRSLTDTGKLHDQYLTCGIRQRDDVKQMQRYKSEWKIVKPRFLSPIPLQTGNCPFALQPTRQASGAKAVRATHVLSGARNRCSMASANG